MFFSVCKSIFNSGVDELLIFLLRQSLPEASGDFAAWLLGKVIG
jgi:hypothetical protein